MEKAGLFLSWSQLLLIGAIVILLYIAKQIIQFYFIRQRNNPTTDIDISVRLTSLEHELELLRVRLDLTLEIRDDVIDVRPKSKLSDITSSQDQMHYSIAIDMAKSGKCVAEIAEKCEIPLAEADLIVAIYRGVYKG